MINKNKVCSVESCQSPAKAKGLCAVCYSREYTRLCKEGKQARKYKLREKEEEPWKTSGFFGWDEVSVLI